MSRLSRRAGVLSGRNRVAAAAGALTGPAGTLTSRWVGAVTPSTATVALKTATATQTRAYLTVAADGSGPKIYGSTATPDANGMSKVTFTGLTAGTSYTGWVEPGPTVDTGKTFALKTFPAAGSAASFRFQFGSCWDQARGSSAAFTAMNSRPKDLFVNVGDMYYGDLTSNTPASVRGFFDTVMSNAAYATLLASVPTAYIWSDHDYADNDSDSLDPAKPASQVTYRQYVPHYPLPAADAIYQTFVYGRVRFILTDNRSYKTDLTAADSASKTVLGAVQKQWFKDTITNATEPVIVWACENPWIASAGAGPDMWGAYSFERTELANHISSSGKKVVIISGDQHSLAADDGTNSAGGVPVFHAAPFDNTTSVKGGPYSAGSYTASTTNFGEVVVTDTGGTTISLAYTGYDAATQTARITQTASFTVPAASDVGLPAGMVGGPAGSFSTAFADDFTGTSLDATRWYAPSNWQKNGAATDPAGISVSGSVLKMVRTRLTSQAGDVAGTTGTGVFVSSADGGQAGVQMLVGDYVESRVWFSGNGSQHYNWSAWWTSAGTWPAGGEHDLAEVLGGALTVNYWRDVSGTAQGVRVYDYPYLGNGWHVFGLHRKASSADYYLDGTLVATRATTDTGQSHALLYTVGHSGDAVNAAGDTGALLVDWVRLWRPPSTAASVAVSRAALSLPQSGPVTAQTSVSAARLSLPGG